MLGRNAKNTRSLILDAAYDLFYQGGFAGLGVDAVAARAGITKRTLYYHFESKDSLIAAMLERQHELAWQRIARWSDAGSDGPQEATARLFEEIRAWVTRPDWRGSGFSRAAMELAGLPGHPARTAARRHKAAVEGALARMLGRTDAPNHTAARRLMILIEGALALTLIHGDTAYVDEAAAAAATVMQNTV